MDYKASKNLATWATINWWGRDLRREYWSGLGRDCLDAALAYSEGMPEYANLSATDIFHELLADAIEHQVAESFQFVTLAFLAALLGINLRWSVDWSAVAAHCIDPT